MRKNAKKYIELECHKCKKIFNKELKEYTRQNKNKKSNFYCSEDCLNERKSDIYSPFRRFISDSRKSSKHKKFDFNLTIEYLSSLWKLQNGICPYTKIKMELEKNCGLSNRFPKYPTKPSLDRINSNKGYIKGNVEFVCMSINYAKNDFTKQEMIDFINKIRDNKV